ncbi:unknown [Bacteroides sp. CAG:144]|nr:unknown [Bacteroides sp. CAG:144]
MLVPAAIPIKMHRQNNFGTSRNSSFHSSRIEIVGLRRRFYKNRNKTIVGYGQNGCHIGIGRHNDLITFLHFSHLDISTQNKTQRIETVTTSYDVGNSEVSRQIPLECRYPFTAQIPTRIDNLGSHPFQLFGITGVDFL